MKKIGLLAYGQTGFFALSSLCTQFQILWIVLSLEKDNEQSSILVEQLAEKNKIKVLKVKTGADLKNIIENNTPDVVVISSYNKIISQEVLQLTKFINVHHGDLPRFRGRANSNWAIILGRSEVGLSIHDAIPELDAGNIYAQYKVTITAKDTVKTVYDKFNAIIKRDLATVVKKVLSGYKGMEQQGQPTYCCTRLPEDGYIDWSKNTKDIYNLVRALTHPFPGAFSFLDGKKLFIWDSEIPKYPKIYEGRIAGRICEIHKNYGVEVLTGDTSIIIKRVTYENREANAVEVIRSVKKTLGINIVELYEKIQRFER